MGWFESLMIGRDDVVGEGHDGGMKYDEMECTRLSHESVRAREGSELLRWCVRDWCAADAVIVDTETTSLDGVAVEIAVVSLCTGEVVFDSVVSTPVEIDEEARSVHQISDAEVGQAPSLSAVADDLTRVTRGRPVLAYNAPFDRDVLARSCAAEGIEMLIESWQWECVMRYRRAGEMQDKFTRLGGNHRAVGDCMATRDLILSWA